MAGWLENLIKGDFAGAFAGRRRNGELDNFNFEHPKIPLVGDKTKGLVGKAKDAVIGRQEPAPIVDRSMTTAQLEESGKKLEAARQADRQKDLDADAKKQIEWADAHEAKPTAAAVKTADAAIAKASESSRVEVAAAAPAKVEAPAQTRSLGSVAARADMTALDTIRHTHKGDLPEGEQKLNGRFADASVYDRARAKLEAAGTMAPEVTTPKVTARQEVAPVQQAALDMTP